MVAAGPQQRRSMKKFLAIAVIVAVYQSWGDISGFFADSPEYVTAGGGIALYATEWCGYCQKTREFFAENDIEYVEYDIEKSAERNREHKELGGRGVPLVNVGGTIIHGYDPSRIRAAIRDN